MGPEYEICVEIGAQYTFLPELYNDCLVALMHELLVEYPFLQGMVGVEQDVCGP